jgi:Myosin head (motor domain)
MSAPRDPTQMQELTRLISTSNNTSIYPTDDSIISLLHARFRHDQPYTRLAPSSSTFVIVNPFKHMPNLDDESLREYKARCYDATDDNSKPPLQPHPYQLATSIYSFMRRRNQSQAVVFRCVQCPTRPAHMFHFRSLPVSSSITSLKRLPAIPSCVTVFFSSRLIWTREPVSAETLPKA